MMRALTASFLAFIIGVSSLNFTLGAHYCMDSLQHFSLLGRAKGCEHAAASSQKVCPVHGVVMNEEEKDDKNCCDDQLMVVNGLDHPSGPEQAPPVPVFAALLPPLPPIVHSLEIAAIARPDFLHFKPPLIARDLPVLYQSFLH